MTDKPVKLVSKRDLGPCVCGCGRKADMPKHGLSRVCYSSVRRWANVKTPRERAKYAFKLVYRMRRIDLVDTKEVVIGTSPYKWKKATDRMVNTQFRRQRGNVR